MCLEGCADLFIRQSSLLHEILRAVCGNSDLAAELPVDLDGILDLLLLRQGGIVFRPGMAQEVVLLSQGFPEFCRQIGGKGREQEHDLALNIGYKRRRKAPASNLLLCSIEFVHKLHDGGNAGIKVPSSLEIIGYALDGLMELALD